MVMAYISRKLSWSIENFGSAVYGFGPLVFISLASASSDEESNLIFHVAFLVLLLRRLLARGRSRLESWSIIEHQKKQYMVIYVGVFWAFGRRLKQDSKTSGGNWLVLFVKPKMVNGTKKVFTSVVNESGVFVALAWILFELYFYKLFYDAFRGLLYLSKGRLYDTCLWINLFASLECAMLLYDSVFTTCASGGCKFMGRSMFCPFTLKPQLNAIIDANDKIVYQVVGCFWTGHFLRNPHTGQIYRTLFYHEEHRNLLPYSIGER